MRKIEKSWASNVGAKLKFLSWDWVEGKFLPESDGLHYSASKKLVQTNETISPTDQLLISKVMMQFSSQILNGTYLYKKFRHLHNRCRTGMYVVHCFAVYILQTYGMNVSDKDWFLWK